MSKFNWQRIEYSTYRAKCMGGWILKTDRGVLFIQDETHEWYLSSYGEQNDSKKGYEAYKKEKELLAIASSKIPSDNKPLSNNIKINYHAKPVKS